jgi:hypothetical protein
MPFTRLRSVAVVVVIIWAFPQTWLSVKYRPERPEVETNESLEGHSSESTSRTRVGSGGKANVDIVHRECFLRHRESQLIANLKFSWQPMLGCLFRAFSWRIEARASVNYQSWRKIPRRANLIEKVKPTLILHEIKKDPDISHRRFGNKLNLPYFPDLATKSFNMTILGLNICDIYPNLNWPLMSLFLWLMASNMEELGANKGAEVAALLSTGE